MTDKPEKFDDGEKRIELKKLEYDKAKTYAMFMLTGSITLAIGYISTKDLIFGVLAIVLSFSSVYPIFLMESTHNKLIDLLSKVDSNKKRTV